MWRVQVKSTRYMGERRFSITARGCTDAYTEDEIDFLAVYIVPLDIWYVIPVKAFTPRKCLRFYPEDEGSLGRYEKYREAWWLMKGRHQSRDKVGWCSRFASKEGSPAAARSVQLARRASASFWET